MSWRYILSLLGPGLHWSRTQSDLRRAIDRAERDGQHDAAHHLRIILDLRNTVHMDQKEAPHPGAGEGLELERQPGGDNRNAREL